jgi:MoxR-like ATPase
MTTSFKSATGSGTREAVASGLVGQLEAQVGTVLRGKQEVVRLAVVCLLAKGHVLIEDVPGVGKTTLAQALARSLGVDFQRIQFTSDLLPSDILGVSIFRQETQAFEFVRGPLFANVVLADEINRASPKTQSALLEAMSERRVSVDGVPNDLPEPFLVLATQNPLEYVGTFPLPESQLDRFTMSLRIGYPPRIEERDLLLSGGVEGTMSALRPAISRQELLQLQEWVGSVHVAEKVVDYMLALAGASRTASSDFLLGVSTRGLQGLYRSCQAMALCDGRDFVVPDDVQKLATPVLAHRLVLKSGDDSPDAGRAALKRLVAGLSVPV